MQQLTSTNWPITQRHVQVVVIIFIIIIIVIIIVINTITILATVWSTLSLNVVRVVVRLPLYRRRNRGRFMIWSSLYSAVCLFVCMACWVSAFDLYTCNDVSVYTQRSTCSSKKQTVCVHLGLSVCLFVCLYVCMSLFLRRRRIPARNNVVNAFDWTVALDLVLIFSPVNAVIISSSVIRLRWSCAILTEGILITCYSKPRMQCARGFATRIKAQMSVRKRKTKSAAVPLGLLIGLNCKVIVR